MAGKTWQEKAQSKRTQAAAAIPRDWILAESFRQNTTQNDPTNVLGIPRKCGILDEQELDITENYDATALLEKIASGQFTAVKVTTAFSKRAAIAQQLTNCLTETFFERALSRARELDEHLATTGKPVGPLHGLPISIKDSFSVSGIPTTIGFVSFLDQPPRMTNSALVDVLLAAGAVLYVKTNIPQTMMTADSHNNVFGRVLNPHSLHLGAGGSSGGEGALVAMRGSILGIGTDIAGSIRIPALCCGVVGFKPSEGRVPYGGQLSGARPGGTGIGPVAGPLCHSVRDAEMLLRVVFDSNAADLDSGVLGVHFRPYQSQSTLTIGLMPEDPLLPLHPPMQRTLEAAIDKLAAAGHRIIDLSGQFPSLSDAKAIAWRYFSMDPENTPLSHVKKSGEPYIPSLKHTYDLTESGPEPTLRELYKLNIARSEFKGRILQAFVENKLDIILGPGYQSCAVSHDSYGIPEYTLISNYLNYPACVIPYSQADRVADKRYIRDVTYTPKYKPQEIDGAPCHIHLTGRYFQEEKLLRDAAVVESALRS
ncbi:amidase [Aspergillus ambiguus]|uniref:amidase n=1 Tax=Aspergillus ambiguus TaxID=176160 RepID=UPI003CCE21B7